MPTRKKRTRIPQDKPALADGVVLSPEASGWKGNILSMSGWLAAACMGVLNLPGAINSFVKEFPTAAESTGIWLPIDPRINGDWSAVKSCTQDYIELPDLSGPEGNLKPKVGLDLQLVVQGSTISGSILSKGLSSNAPWPEAFLAGRVDGTTARLKVFDWIDGKPVTFSNIDVKRMSGGCLRFEVVDPDASSLFPVTSILARKTEGYFDSLPREGGFLKQVIEDVVSKSHSNDKK